MERVGSAGRGRHRSLTRAHWLRVAAVSCLLTPSVAAAHPQIALSGAAPQTAVSVSIGPPVSLTITGGPGNNTDWVGLYAAGAPNHQDLSWRYLNNATTAPSHGLSTAMPTFASPKAAGRYEFRFFAKDGFNRIATSAILTLVSPPPHLTVNGVAPPAAVTAVPGTMLSLGVTDGPGHPRAGLRAEQNAI